MDSLRPAYEYGRARDIEELQLEEETFLEDDEGVLEYFCRYGSAVHHGWPVCSQLSRTGSRITSRVPLFRILFVGIRQRRGRGR